MDYFCFLLPFPPVVVFESNHASREAEKKDKKDDEKKDDEKKE